TPAPIAHAAAAEGEAAASRIAESTPATIAVVSCIPPTVGRFDFISFSGIFSELACLGNQPIKAEENPAQQADNRPYRAGMKIRVEVVAGNGASDDRREKLNAYRGKSPEIRLAGRTPVGPRRILHSTALQNSSFRDSMRKRPTRATRAPRQSCFLSRSRRERPKRTSPRIATGANRSRARASPGKTERISPYRTRAHLPRFAPFQCR